VAGFVVSAHSSEIEKQQRRLSSSDVEERRDAVMRLGSMRLAAASRAALPALKMRRPSSVQPQQKQFSQSAAKRALDIYFRSSMIKTNSYVAKQLMHWD
jgi:hypothetical protein